MVAAVKCGSYAFKSTLIAADLRVQTAAIEATPASLPAKCSPLKKSKRITKNNFFKKYKYSESCGDKWTIF